ncbi:hypothetical protein BGZ65_002263, partial [Modicella reniformis]
KAPKRTAAAAGKSRAAIRLGKRRAHNQDDDDDYVDDDYYYYLPGRKRTRRAIASPIFQIKSRPWL